jgi:hypothetical protein
VNRGINKGSVEPEMAQSHLTKGASNYPSTNSMGVFASRPKIRPYRIKIKYSLRTKTFPFSIL